MLCMDPASMQHDSRNRDVGERACEGVKGVPGRPCCAPIRSLEDMPSLFGDCWKAEA